MGSLRLSLQNMCPFSPPLPTLPPHVIRKWPLAYPPPQKKTYHPPCVPVLGHHDLQLPPDSRLTSTPTTWKSPWPHSSKAGRGSWAGKLQEVGFVCQKNALSLRWNVIFSYQARILTKGVRSLSIMGSGLSARTSLTPSWGAALLLWMTIRLIIPFQSNCGSLVTNLSSEHFSSISAAIYKV